MSPSEELLPVSETSYSEPASASRRSIDYDIDNILDQIGLGAALEPAAPAPTDGPVPSQSEPPAAAPSPEPQLVSQLEEISSTLASLDIQQTDPPAEFATAQQQPEVEQEGPHDQAAVIERETTPEIEIHPQSSRAAALQVLEEEIIRRTAEISQQRRAIERDRAALEEAQANWRQELKSQQQAMEAERQQFVTRQRMIRQEQTEWEKRSAEFAAERTRLREQKQALQLQAAELAAERERVELQAATILVGARVAEITVNERNDYEAQRAALQAERERSAQLESQLTAAREADEARQRAFDQTQQQQFDELQAEREKSAQLAAQLTEAESASRDSAETESPTLQELQARLQEAEAQRVAAEAAQCELQSQVAALAAELSVVRSAPHYAPDQPPSADLTPAPETATFTPETDSRADRNPESVTTFDDVPTNEGAAASVVSADAELDSAELDAAVMTAAEATAPTFAVDENRIPPAASDFEAVPPAPAEIAELASGLTAHAEELPVSSGNPQSTGPVDEDPELAAAVSRIANLLAASPVDSAPESPPTASTSEPVTMAGSADDDEHMDFAARLARLRAEMLQPQNAELTSVEPAVEETAINSEDLRRRRKVVDVDTQRDHRISLREVAQASAHSALSQHRGKQLRSAALLKSGLALLCFLAAIAFLSGEFVGSEVAGVQGTLFLVIGIYFAFDAFQKVVQLGVIMARRRADLKSLLELSGVAAVGNPSREEQSADAASPNLDTCSGPEIP